LALKDEELKKTRQILKEVTDEKEKLVLKVKLYLFMKHNIIYPNKIL